MGKRSDFKRVERDLYDTPAAAVQPLLPWLKPHTPFIEPCYGNGALRRSLEAAGHRFVGGFDLPIDAREHQYGVALGELFITNPPSWGRPRELHPLIENLSNQAPTWLLMSADWLFNKSSGPMIWRLRQIVAVGRVKWIADSRYTGKDNAAWLLFDAHATGFRFVGRTCSERKDQSTPSRNVSVNASCGSRAVRPTSRRR